MPPFAPTERDEGSDECHAIKLVVHQVQGICADTPIAVDPKTKNTTMTRLYRSTFASTGVGVKTFAQSAPSSEHADCHLLHGLAYREEGGV